MKCSIWRVRDGRIEMCDREATRMADGGSICDECYAEQITRFLVKMQQAQAAIQEAQEEVQKEEKEKTGGAYA